MGNKIEELREFIKTLLNNGITQTEIGRQVNYSRSQINKFIEGGKVSEEFIESVEKFQEEYLKENRVEIKNVKKSIEDLDFVLTRDAKSILGVCKATEKMGGFAAILGNAGTGKTESVKHFVKNSDRAVYIRCNCLMATRDILRAIAKACGTVLQATSKAEMFEELVEYLQYEPKTLIFDEVDQIMPVKTINKIETIRNLHDMVKDYGTSLIIVGSLAVEQHFKKRNMYENYGQIDSRLDYLYKTQGLNELEIQSIIAEFDVTESAIVELKRLIIGTTKGGIRWLSKILSKCIDIAEMENEQITEAVVKDASKIIMI